MTRQAIKVNNSFSILPRDTYSGSNLTKLDIKSGARIVFGIHVFNIDAGAKVVMKVSSSFSEAMPFIEAYHVDINKVDTIQKALSDLYNFVNVEIIVLNGTAELICGASIYDNAKEHLPDPYVKKNSQIQELAARGVDLNNANILTNERGIAITLSDGSLIYTE